jgi:hypothetical protein
LCGLLGGHDKTVSSRRGDLPPAFKGAEIMDSGFGSSLAASIFMGLIILVVVVFLLGALTMWGLPKLWLIIKPIIHAVTA